MANVALAVDILARDRASKAFDKVGSSADKAGKNFGNLKRVGVLAVAGMGAAMFKFGSASIAAYGEAERSQKSLELAYKKFPKVANVSIGALRDYNSQLAKKVAFDDDAVASGQSVLAQFDLTGKQIQGVTPLLADYATQTGKSLPESAALMGKAYLGNTKALKALGIDYKSTGDKSKDFANINALLKEKVGGAAEAMGTTAAGKAAILKNQFGELQETVGSKLMPAMLKATEVGLKVVDWISRNSAVIVPLVTGLGTVVAGIKAVTMATAAWSAVTALSPIGLIVIGVAALAAGLVVAYKKSETFRNIVNGALRGVAVAIGFVKDHWKAFATAIAFLIGGPIITAIVLLVANFGKIKTVATAVWSWVTDKFGKLVDFVTGLPGRIATASKGMFDGIKNAFKSALNWVIDKWNGLEFKVPGISAFGKTIGGFTLGVPDIPRLAAGGIVPKTPGGRLVIAGEGRENEAIIPLSRLERGKAGGDVHIHLHGNFMGGADEVAREVRAALLRLKRGSGTNLGLA